MQVCISREEVSKSKDSCVVAQPPTATHAEVDASHIILNAMLFAESGGNLIPTVSVLCRNIRIVFANFRIN